MTRYAIITLSPGSTPADVEARLRTVARFLPDNYSAFCAPLDDGAPVAEIIITGQDVAGWTLDGYVIPRLASGMLWAREYVPAP